MKLVKFVIQSGDKSTLLLHLDQLRVGAFFATFVAFLVQFIGNERNVLAAASYEIDFLLEALDLDVEYGYNAVGCSTSGFFNEERKWADFVQKRQFRRMCNRVKEAEDALSLHEDLVDIESRTTRISQAES